MSRRIHAVFGLTASAVVVATIVWGFLLVGSPTARRTERIDERRLGDLRTIAREIQYIVLDPADKSRLKEPLPLTLEEAAKKARHARSQSARS